jgi:plasmid stabilization system protein ParE
MFRVKIEREAKDNLREHYLNLRKQSSASGYAVEWYRGIRAAIRNLETSAQRCGTAYEDRYFREHIRHRLYDSYKVLFTIRGKVVHVLYIRHQSQDPGELK